MPRVSIIIPTYNRAELVAQAVDSVLAQTYQDREIIVVDDGSTDDTKERLAAYDEHVQYVYQVNAGVYTARNAGVRLSRGEYIAFLDSDDLWEPDKLALQVAVLDERPSFGAVHTDTSAIDEEGRIVKSPVNPRRQSHDGMVFDEFFQANMAVILLSTVMLRRSCFEKTGFFDERFRMVADHFFFLKLAFHYPVSFIARPLVRYRMTAGSLSRENILENLQCREQLLHEFIDEYDDYFSKRPALVKDRWRHFSRKAAMDLFHAGNYAASRTYFRRAGVQHPKALLYAGLAHLPPAVLKWMSGVKSKIHTSSNT